MKRLLERWNSLPKMILQTDMVVVVAVVLLAQDLVAQAQVHNQADRQRLKLPLWQVCNQNSNVRTTLKEMRKKR